METKVDPSNPALFDSTFQEYADRFDEQMYLMESVNFDIPKGALLMMENLKEAVDCAAKNAIVFDEKLDLRRNKVGIQMLKLRSIYNSSENPSKTDLDWIKMLDKHIKKFEEEIAEFEDLSPSCNSDAVNPVHIEENLDEDNSHVETEPETKENPGPELKEEAADATFPSLDVDPQTEEETVDKDDDEADATDCGAFPSDDSIAEKPDNDKKLARTDQVSSSDAGEEIKAHDGPQEETAEDATDVKTIVQAAVQEEALAATMDGDAKKALDVPREGFDAKVLRETDETSIDAEATFPFDPGEENEVFQADGNPFDDECSESQVVMDETLDFQPVGPSVVLCCDLIAAHKTYILTLRSVWSHVQMQETTYPEMQPISKLIAVPRSGPAKAPIEGEGVEEEPIDEQEAQSAGNQGDQDESDYVQLFMIMLSV